MAEGSVAGSKALSGPVPRGADAREASGRAGVATSGRSRGDRLLPIGAHAGRRSLERIMGHALAEPCLSLASRRLRLSRRGRHPGDRRRFSDPGHSRGSKRLRPSIPSRSDPRDDLPVDRDGGRTFGDAGCAGPDPANRGTVPLRSSRGPLARQVSGRLARPDAGPSRTWLPDFRSRRIRTATRLVSFRRR